MKNLRQFSITFTLSKKGKLKISMKPYCQDMCNLAMALIKTSSGVIKNQEKLLKDYLVKNREASIEVFWVDSFTPEGEPQTRSDFHLSDTDMRKEVSTILISLAMICIDRLKIAIEWLETFKPEKARQLYNLVKSHQGILPKGTFELMPAKTTLINPVQAFTTSRVECDFDENHCIWKVSALPSACFFDKWANKTALEIINQQISLFEAEKDNSL